MKTSFTFEALEQRALLTAPAVSPNPEPYVNDNVHMDSYMAILGKFVWGGLLTFVGHVVLFEFSGIGGRNDYLRPMTAGTVLKMAVTGGIAADLTISAAVNLIEGANFAYEVVESAIPSVLGAATIPVAIYYTAGQELQIKKMQ